MGYTTDFNGELDIYPHLTPDQVAYLQKFSETRRMARDVKKLRNVPDPLRIAVGLPLGMQGAYFLGDASTRYADAHVESILNNNQPPGLAKYTADKAGNWDWQEYERLKAQSIDAGAQPGLWCQWTVDDEGTVLKWDEGEKFYEYVEWLRYLLRNFYTPWGYTLTGEIYWDGEESDDRGRILMNGAKNEVTVQTASITYA